MKRRSVFMLACFIAKACGKKDTFGVYQEKGGLFSCRAPLDWRVLENQGGVQKVSFFGPASGMSAFSVSISVYFYSAGSSQYRIPKEYAAAHAGGALAQELPWKGAKVLDLISEPKENFRERTVLIPSDKGFFALVYRASVSAYSQTAPIFEELLESFKF